MEKLKAYQHYKHEINCYQGDMEYWERLVNWANRSPLTVSVAAEVQPIIDHDKNKINTAKKNREVIKSAINSVEDKTLREVLEKRYLEDLTVEKIADAMMYGVAHVYRLHKKALDALIRLNVL